MSLASLNAIPEDDREMVEWFETLTGVRLKDWDAKHFDKDRVNYHINQLVPSYELEFPFL